MDGLTNYCTVSFVTGRTLTPSGIEYVFEYLCSALSSVASSALHKTHLATIALNFTPWKAGSGFFPEESIPYWEVFEVARAQAHAATTNF
jgi:hypothetical protein